MKKTTTAVHGRWRHSDGLCSAGRVQRGGYTDACLRSPALNSCVREGSRPPAPDSGKWRNAMLLVIASKTDRRDEDVSLIPPPSLSPVHTPPERASRSQIHHVQLPVWPRHRQTELYYQQLRPSLPPCYLGSPPRLPVPPMYSSHHTGSGAAAESGDRPTRTWRRRPRVKRRSAWCAAGVGMHNPHSPSRAWSLGFDSLTQALVSITFEIRHFMSQKSDRKGCDFYWVPTGYLMSNVIVLPAYDFQFWGLTNIFPHLVVQRNYNIVAKLIPVLLRSIAFMLPEEFLSVQNLLSVFLCV
jgi:hypothetical protein